MSTDLDVGEMKLRIESLERRQSIIAVAGIASVFVCGAVLSAASTMAQDGARDAPARRPDAIRDRLEAHANSLSIGSEVKHATADDYFQGKEFAVVDGSDPRGWFGRYSATATNPAETNFAILDSARRLRIAMGVDDSGKAFIAMLDSRGRRRFYKQSR